MKGHPNGPRKGPQKGSQQTLHNRISLLDGSPWRGAQTLRKRISFLEGSMARVRTAGRRELVTDPSELDFFISRVYAAMQADPSSKEIL